MNDGLFEIGDPQDPLAPGWDAPTAVGLVAQLSPENRIRRVMALHRQALAIVDEALTIHLSGKRLAAQCILFSGGDDSTVLAHMFRHRATHAIHCNTTVGIEETRQFVRDTCEQWGLPLLEEYPPKSFRDLVIERGFPGPAQHWKYYHRLKERGLRSARRKLVGDGRKERVLYLAGRRREESRRRADIVLHERESAVIWASPLANWTKLDLNTYRQVQGDVPQNPVSALLHRSGECNCGAFAKPGELEEMRQWFPRAAAEIDEIASAVAAAGHPEPLCRWGHGEGRKTDTVKTGRLCSSCEIPLFDLPDGAA